MASSNDLYRIGCDVGGTFTDVFLLNVQTGETWQAKVPSTPEDQSVGVRTGIDQILDKIPDGSNVVLQVLNHGTTVGTNAILEGRGAKVALIVTEGYRDLLQTRRSQVPGGLASWITWKKPEPLAPLEMTIEAPGRIATDGGEVRPFNAELFTQRLRQSLVPQKPESICVCLANSFANPAHEQAVLRVLADVLPDIPISLSSEVLPELMEYERAVTTVCNSYIKPKVASYLNNLLKSLQEKTKHLRILRSDGGLSSVSLATRFPVTLCLSGPAGGVSGVVSVVAAETKYRNLVTVDMGGTSTDVSLIEDGQPRIRRETHVADLIVKSPSVDVRTCGAGGGSIAHVPEVTKSLRVGPESAGAVPGPACYGKGGTQATVTDANAVLGYLPEFLLDGTFKLDLEAARRAVQKTADDLGISLYEAAEGIIRIVNETMYGALRLVSIEQGYDPRDFSLVAFGGAGPLHGNALGMLLHAFPVIIPPSPGVLCARGDATTILRHEETRTFIRTLGHTSNAEIIHGYDELLAKAAKIMLEEQGVPKNSQVFKYQADLRYLGQAITIPVDVHLGQLQSDAAAHISDLFEKAHQKAFTYKLSSAIEVSENSVVERKSLIRQQLMNLRIVAEEVPPEYKIKKLKPADTPEPDPTAVIGRTTLVYHNTEFKESPIWKRSLLTCGHVVRGPCIVTELDSNTLVLPGFKAEVDEIGNLLIWPLESAVLMDPAEKDLDSVAVDIFESALRNARNEMDTLMTRASLSPAIREQQDEFNVIAEPSGKMIVGQFGSFIGQFLERWKGTVEENDVFLVNDPYSIGGSVSHLNDWLVMMPVHMNGKLIAWAANFGHMTDNGGAVPGSLPTGAMSIFEEGIQIPVTKVASRGVWNEALMELLYRNCRLPEWNRGDTQALVAACTLAGRRMQELYTRFGDKNYFAAINELLDRNRKVIGSLINNVIPEEPVYFEDWIDDDGRGVGPWKVACTMSKSNGILRLDFTGTDPQSPSSVNYYLSHNMFKMFLGIYLVTVYDPRCVVNDGFHDLVEMYIPEGTLLNPIRPAALSSRTHLLGRVMDLLSGLLGQKAPEFMTAGAINRFKENGEWYQLYQIGFGGIPARPHGDGMDGHCVWPAMKSVPNEFLELYYPLRIEEYNTVTDSGGPGLWRGGNAQRIFYRFLDEGEVSIHDDRWLSKPWGVLGGAPGGRSSKILVHDGDGSGRREVLQSKQDHIKVQKGDKLEWLTWGGGGYGDALKRDAKFVALEVHRGLVSFEGAKRYGVVVNPDYTVDEAATTALRSEMASARPAGPPEIFNRGGTWDELRAKALEETGLPAPKLPWEVPLRGPMTALPYFKEWKKRHGVKD
ncbi:5-oxoprolinase [Roridomyces roridus]|uniref:5-oxoprolinase n=1 Tax=Roridomyces roridus TaxID=1738132 RepID=A0AAD7G2H2_9AGAR|nr:5-oxoprolinase [Roridomyces roridus]